MSLPTHVICPEDAESRYPTPGKAYAITGWFNEPTGFRIVDDDGAELICRTKGCAHLNLRRALDWIIPQPLEEALDLLATASERLNDMLEGDDAQAWGEARKFAPLVKAFLASHGRGAQIEEPGDDR